MELQWSSGYHVRDSSIAFMGILHCRAVTNPLNRWMDLGTSLSLGTDDYPHDMLQLLRKNITGQKLMSIDGEVGSLRLGKKADVIIIDMLNPYLTPTKDPLTSIVLYGTSGDIDTVIVDGNILKYGGALTNIDMQEALITAQDSVEEIIERFFEDHPEQGNIWIKLLI